MKILIISQYYYPEQFQINEIAPELVRRGHEVSVVTGLPNYPVGEIYPEYKNYHAGTLQPEIIEGVSVYRCNIKPRKHGLISLFKNYFSFMSECSRLVDKLGEYDVVFSYELSPITQSYPAVKYAKKRNKKLLLYCLDLWPLSGEKYYKKIPFLYSIVHRFSRHMYNSADVVAVTSKSFYQYLNRVNDVPLDKIVFLPQHADDSLAKNHFTNEDNGVVDFLFAGNVGSSARLETMVDAVKLLKDENNFMVHIVGDGSKLDYIKDKVRTLGLENRFVFYGQQKRADMSYYYNLADVLYISLRNGNTTLPGKFQMYLSAGKPILGSISGDACEIIDELKCGAYAPPENPEQLAKLMKLYIHGEMPNVDAEKMKKHFLDNYTLEKYVDNLEGLLNGLSANS